MGDKKEQSRKTEVVSISEAARINGTSRQAIHVAIGNKRLKATKDPKSGRLKIFLADLQEYRRNQVLQKMF